MSDPVESLTEALSGIVQEQKALQAYASDYVAAYEAKDLKTMLDAMRGALLFYKLLLSDFDETPGVENALREIEKLRGRLGEVEVKRRVRAKTRRR